jgi:hypothetical protein
MLHQISYYLSKHNCKNSDKLQDNESEKAAHVLIELMKHNTIRNCPCGIVDRQEVRIVRIYSSCIFQEFYSVVPAGRLLERTNIGINKVTINS